MHRALRLAFMGTPSFAVPALEVLLQRPGELLAVYTQPDKPAGRGQALVASAVKERAAAAGVEVRQPRTLKDDATFEAFEKLALDLCVVAAYGKILPERYLEAPRLGCVNVHASLLPKYRGAAPIQWAIARGETETGITLMQMDPGMDTGDILLQRSVAISPGDTAGRLHDTLAELGGRLLAEGLARLREEPLPRTPQDDAQATMAPMLRKSDGAIDWTKSAAEVVRWIHAMNPWPGAFTHHRGKRLKILRARIGGSGLQASPGCVVATHKGSNGGLEVACGTGTAELEEVQAEGRKRMAVADFLVGYRIEEGEELVA